MMMLFVLSCIMLDLIHQVYAGQSNFNNSFIYDNIPLNNANLYYQNKYIELYNYDYN